MNSISDFIYALRAVPSEQRFFNFYRDFEQGADASERSPIIRLENCSDYLLERFCAKVIVIGQAPGPEGQRFSGIPMVSEFHCQGSKCLDLGLSPLDVLMRPIECSSFKSSSGAYGYEEKTSTRVASAILNSGVDPRQLVFWNAFPFLLTKELNPSRLAQRDLHQLGRRFLAQFLALYPGVPVIPMGVHARELLKTMNVSYLHWTNLPTRESNAQFLEILLELSKAGILTQKN